MCRPHVVETCEGDNKLTHLLTYGGHAAACAAALANIAIIESEGLVENSAKMGAHLLDCLNSLGDHPILGDVRGLGLIAGIELVKNQETKEKFSESSNEMMYLNKGLQDRGLLTRASHIISLSPPLCITKDEVERIVAIIDDAVGDLEQKFGFA